MSQVGASIYVALFNLVRLVGHDAAVVIFCGMASVFFGAILLLLRIKAR